MCKRLIINAGISTVIIRNTRDKYTTINVQNWIENDDSLPKEYTVGQGCEHCGCDGGGGAE